MTKFEDRVVAIIRSVTGLSKESAARFLAERAKVGLHGRDPAEALPFLTADQASWITGALLPVDGGVTVGRH